MKLLQRLSLFVVFTLLVSCSLPPEKIVTRKVLFGTGVYQKFVIDESPEQILNALNMEGEVVLKAQEGSRPVYVKILATADGLLVSSYDR
ncbi:MAG TPA: hypothetical protein VIR78_02120 [Malonomonas sp.]